jgi:excisionase family DNA binding protein
MPPTGDILTVNEVSRYLKIPKSTIYMMTSRSLIPFFKVGKQLRFSREGINAWIREKEMKSMVRGEKPHAN